MVLTRVLVVDLMPPQIFLYHATRENTSSIGCQPQWCFVEDYPKCVQQTDNLPATSMCTRLKGILDVWKLDLVCRLRFRASGMIRSLLSFGCVLYCRQMLHSFTTSVHSLNNGNPFNGIVCGVGIDKLGCRGFALPRGHVCRLFTRSYCVPRFV